MVAFSKFAVAAFAGVVRAYDTQMFAQQPQLTGKPGDTLSQTSVKTQDTLTENSEETFAKSQTFMDSLNSFDQTYQDKMKEWGWWNHNLYVGKSLVPFHPKDDEVWEAFLLLCHAIHNELERKERYQKNLKTYTPNAGITRLVKVLESEKNDGDKYEKMKQVAQLICHHNQRHALHFGLGGTQSASKDSIDSFLGGFSVEALKLAVQLVEHHVNPVQLTEALKLLKTGNITPEVLQQLAVWCPKIQFHDEKDISDWGSQIANWGSESFSQIEYEEKMTPSPMGQVEKEQKTEILTVKPKPSTSILEDLENQVYGHQCGVSVDLECDTREYIEAHFQELTTDEQIKNLFYLILWVMTKKKKGIKDFSKMGLDTSSLEKHDFQIYCYETGKSVTDFLKKEDAGIKLLLKMTENLKTNISADVIMSFFPSSQKTTK